MSARATSSLSSCCWRKFVRSIERPTVGKRCISLQVGRVEKLDVPANLPKQYWSQLPQRIRPDRGKREIVIHPAPPSERATCNDPIKIIDEQQRQSLDPTGARSRLFDPKNPDGAKPGDILVATFKSGEPFSGIAMSIKYRGPHTSVLLRNHLTRIGTEMDVKVFSPLVQSMEIAQKAVKRPRRARLYYLRKPKHDIGSVQKVVDQYMRQRAMLTGGRPQGSRQQQQRGRGNSRSRS